jgi:hypothetical protein
MELLSGSLVLLGLLGAAMNLGRSGPIAHDRTFGCWWPLVLSTLGLLVLLREVALRLLESIV